MSLLFETILIKNGKAPFLHFHQHRIDYTRKKLFNRSDPLKIPLPATSQNEVYRYKVIYGKTLQETQLMPYKRSFKKNCLAIEANIDYNSKFVNREELDDLKTKNPNFDEILVVKKGLITDTTIANCAFFDGNRWLTPSTPLLRGTCRERLIQSRFIFPGKIYLKDLRRYSHVAFFNGLTGFYIAGKTQRIIYAQ